MFRSLRLRAVSLTLILNLALPAVSAFARPNRIVGDRSAGVRHVGVIMEDGRPTCTATLLKHGVLLTARHCFEHGNVSPRNFDPTRYSIRFPHARGGRDVVIHPSEMRGMRFDSGNNDIAYMSYLPRATKRRIAIPRTRINVGPTPRAGTPIRHTGFPSLRTGQTRRVTTRGCVIRNHTGYLPPRPMDPGYHGRLQDTTCPAYYGDSGSPVYRLVGRGQNQVMEILGVLTHTFQVNRKTGEVNRSAITHDRYGSFSTRSNYSPMSSARSLKTVLGGTSLLTGTRPRRPRPRSGGARR